MVKERAYWLAWSQIPGVGPILIRRLQQQLGTLEAAWNASAAALETVDGFGPQTAAVAAIARRSIDPERLLDQHQQENPYFWTPADPDYPRLLLEIPDPPPVLYYRGRVEPLENQGSMVSIAIVGTRSPSDYGRRWTRKLSTVLAQAGFTVVSGLADGIDTEAHQSCLAASGRTIAVLGTGVDVVYPESNRRLADQIGQQGLLLSEYPAGTLPDRVNFPRRNRIIAGLCPATLVLEAPQKSGALITARLANDYGRDVYALPGSLDNSRARGCLDLLHQGASFILDETHLLEQLGTMPAVLHTAPAPTQLSLLARSELVSPQVEPDPIALDPGLQSVLHAVTLDPIAIDRIVLQSGLSTAAVLSALAQLELMGFVTQLPGMRYQKEA